MDPYLVQPMSQDQHDHEMLVLQSQQFEVVMNDLKIPIGSNAGLQSTSHAGVVKIKNMPYTATRQEVQHFFGRHARLATDWPIHILMERSSGKTTDCYVEFISDQEAREAINRVKHNVAIGQVPRMGIRHIDILHSNQDELMQAMFPMANCIKWTDGLPIKMYNRPGEDWSAGFNGFVTNEEMFCTVRYSELPQRSKFAYKSPQRTYEFMISTMKKYPWHATSMYTVHERNKIFQALRFMIEALVTRMKTEQVVGLDKRLVTELIQVGLRCPAFNPRMKFCLSYVGEDYQTAQKMPEIWMTYFPFDTLTWLPPFNPVTMEFYASLLSKANVANHSAKGLIQRWDSEKLLEPYGQFWFEWDEQTLAKSSSTFADCIDYEKNVLREMLAAGFKNGQMASKGKDSKEYTLDSVTSGLSTASTKQMSSLATAVTAPVGHPPRLGNIPIAPDSQAFQGGPPSGVLATTYRFPPQTHSSHASESWVTDHPFSPTLGTQHWPNRSESHIQLSGFGHEWNWGQAPTQSRGQVLGRGQGSSRGQARGRGQASRQIQDRGQPQIPFTGWADNRGRGHSRGGFG